MCYKLCTMSRLSHVKFVGFTSKKWMNISSFMSSIYWWGSWAQGCWCAQTRHISQWWSRWAPGSQRCNLAAQSGWMGKHRGSMRNPRALGKRTTTAGPFSQDCPWFQPVGTRNTWSDPGRVLGKPSIGVEGGSVRGGFEQQIMKLVRLLRDCRAQTSRPRA